MNGMASKAATFTANERTCVSSFAAAATLASRRPAWFTQGRCKCQREEGIKDRDKHDVIFSR